MIYKIFISLGGFTDIWKKSNICPIHKKNDKLPMNTYGPGGEAYFQFPFQIS